MKLSNTSIRGSKAAIFPAALAPAVWLAWRGLHNHLGANPIETVTHATGDWTLRFLLITLLVTPLRRLLGMPELVRYRRMLGLFAFFYGCLHFLTYFVLDKFFDWHEIWQDIATEVHHRWFDRTAPDAPARGDIDYRVDPAAWRTPLAIDPPAHLLQHAGRGHPLLLAGQVGYPVAVLYGVILGVLLLYRLIASRTNRPADVNQMKLVRIERQTHDTVTLQFQLAGNKPLQPKPGQFLTFDWVVGGKKVPRSYSISSSPRQTHVEVTVKKQGVVSSFLNDKAKAGLKVKAHGPYGQFQFEESRDRRIVLFAAGSGITPIMSMLRHIEDAGADTEITLFYAVRTERDIIFDRELERLQQRLTKFRCVLIASQPGTGWKGARGHVNRELVTAHLDTANGRTFFLCGPIGFMAAVKEILQSLGVGSDQIRQESFNLGSGATKAGASAPTATCTLEFARSGRRLEASSALTVLTIAEDNGIEIPYSC